MNALSTVVRSLFRLAILTEDLDPLTPSNASHILTMKSKVVMPPPGDFQKADVYLRKRWKRVQYLFKRILVKMEKGIRSTSTAKGQMEQPKEEFRKGRLGTHRR